MGGRRAACQRHGNQHAGIQVLNTAQFPVNAGPLSQVHR